MKKLSTTELVSELKDLRQERQKLTKSLADKDTEIIEIKLILDQRAEIERGRLSERQDRERGCILYDDEE